MRTRDTGHRQADLIPEELQDDVRAVAHMLDVTEEAAAEYLLRMGRDAFLDRPAFGENFNIDGAELVLTTTTGGREQAWLHRRTATGWTVSYRLVPQGGRPAVAEVRVFPDEGAGHRGGTWSGDADAVPGGGLPARVVRAEVRVVDDIALVGGRLQEFRKHFGPLTEALGTGDLAGQLATSQAGAKRGRNDRRVAEVAAAYEEALDAGSKSPAKGVAERHGIKVERVHEIMFKARERGLFKGGSPGRAGGQLTDKGRAILADNQDEGKG